MGYFEKFYSKLTDEVFDEFTPKDWLTYFIYKAEQQGIKYLPDYVKDSSIMKSLVSTLDCYEIKGMIDFIFDSDQDIVDRRTVGVWVLSKGWRNSIYQNSQLWLNGEYSPKKKSHNREWKEYDKFAETVSSEVKPSKKVRF